MFKFIHAADLHIDSPLRGLDRYEGAPVEAIRGATRQAFSKLVQLAIDERVSFVVLAGDIYDGDWPDYNTGLFFVKEVRRLEKADIPVVLIRGNHDAESRITSKLSHPANVHELPVDRPDTITFENLRVKLHGQGYAHRAETRNLALDYLAPVPGYYNIGVLHTSIDGREGHEPYCPCTAEQLIAHGYHYWALGHVHKRESVKGEDRIRFPGNIQGRHIRETGPKGCLLVTVDAGRTTEIEFRPLDVFRWAAIEVEIKADCSFDEAVEIAGKMIEDERQQTGGRPMGARIVLTCESSLFRRLADQLERFRHELAARASDQVWVEKVRLRPAATSREESISLSGDAASELQATVAELRSNPEAVDRIFAEGECDSLRKRLPSRFREILKTRDVEEIFDVATALLASGPAEDEG